jgi:hypothetical protein
MIHLPSKIAAAACHWASRTQLTHSRRGMACEFRATGQDMKTRRRVMPCHSLLFFLHLCFFDFGKGHSSTLTPSLNACSHCSGGYWGASNDSTLPFRRVLGSTARCGDGLGCVWGVPRGPWDVASKKQLILEKSSDDLWGTH